MTVLLDDHFISARSAQNSRPRPVTFQRRRSSTRRPSQDPPVRPSRPPSLFDIHARTDTSLFSFVSLFFFNRLSIYRYIRRHNELISRTQMAGPGWYVLLFCFFISISAINLILLRIASSAIAMPSYTSESHFLADESPSIGTTLPHLWIGRLSRVSDRKGGGETSSIHHSSSTDTDIPAHELTPRFHSQADVAVLRRRNGDRLRNQQRRQRHGDECVPP